MFLPTAMFSIYILREKLTFVCLSFHLCKKSSWFFQCQFHMYDATHNVTSSKILWHESETIMTCLYKYMYALETMQLKGNNSSVLVRECFFVIPAHTLGIKEDGNDLSKNFFYLFKKNITYIGWTLKKWGGKKELRKPLSMTLLSLDSTLYHNLHVQLSCIRTC